MDFWEKVLQIRKKFSAWQLYILDVVITALGNTITFSNQTKRKKEKKRIRKRRGEDK